MKFKSNIESQAGIEDSAASAGTAGQILSSLGPIAGVDGVGWVDQSTINAGNAEHVVIYAKNTHTASIAKGTPVYITGTVGATDTVEIAPADAGDSAKMPAVGLLDDTLAVNAFGYVITGGFMDNVTTDPIDSLPSTSNDTVYVKVGGGLTLTKPTGPTGLIQNIAKVGKVSGGNSGSLIVSSILRTNDVPNLTTGKIWVGDGNTVESTVVHLDEVNERMGIGTTSPSQKLHVSGNAIVSGIGVGTTTIYSNSVNLNNSGTLRIGNAEFLAKAGNDLSIYQGKIRIQQGGNVGIGTTSPSYKLDIAGDLRVDNGDLGGTSGDEVTHAKIQGKRHFIDFKEVRTANDTDWRNTTFKIQTGVDSTNHQSIDFVSDGSYQEHIDIRTGNQLFNTRFTYDGKVGIGTTNPAKKLTIGGIGIGNTDGLKIEDPSNTAYGAHYSYDDGSTTVEIGGVVNNSLRDCISIARDATRTITIDTSERVGIGTTSPQAKLHVANGTLRTWTPTTGTSAIFESTVNSRNFLTLTAANEAELWFGNASTQTLGRVRYEMSTNNMEFWTNATQKMVIEGGGNVGIGTTSPRTKLHVFGTVSSMPASGAAPSAAQLGGSSYGTLFSTLTSGRGVIQQGRSDGTAGTYDLLLQPVGGNVGIGESSPSSKLYIQGSTSTTSSQLMRIRSTTSFSTTPGRIIEFIRSNNTIRGYISMNQYGVQYNTSSDYRLKENITPINDALDRLKKLKPNRFSWKEGPSDYKVDGFIAHEVAEVIPEAISGEKDAVDENNKPSYQGIDQAKIVPLLTAALQEAVTKIEQLETRIQTLENK